LAAYPSTTWAHVPTYSSTWPTYRGSTYPSGSYAYPTYSTSYAYPSYSYAYPSYSYSYAYPSYGTYAYPYGYSSYSWPRYRSGLFGRGGFLGTGLFR
jgi:hypothetical protein